MSARYCAQCGYVPYTCSHLDGSQPSPVSASAGERVPEYRQGPELKTAAGDQWPDFHGELLCLRHEGEQTTGCTCGFWLVETALAERDATIATKNAALLAAADALDKAQRSVRSASTNVFEDRLADARDAARSAASAGRET